MSTESFLILNSVLSTRYSVLSLDDPIRSGQDIGWNWQADLFGGFEVDYELKLGWLFDRQIARVGALEDFVHINRYPPVGGNAIGAIVHERPGIYGFTSAVHRRQPSL